MGLRKYGIQGGVVKDDTRYASSGFAIDSQGYRIRNGRFETFGGWADLCAGRTLQGVHGRGACAWADSLGFKYAAFATNAKLYVYQDNQAYDVTPLAAQGALADALATVAGSNVVQVRQPGHGARTGDTVYLAALAPVGGVSLGQSGTFAADPFYMAANSPIVLASLPGVALASGAMVALAGSTALGGVALDGVYSVTVSSAGAFTFQANGQSAASVAGGGTPTWVAYQAFTVTVLNGDTYTVTVPGAATDTVDGGGGAVYYMNELPIGPVDGSLPGGFGLGGYSEGAFGFSAAPLHRADYLPRTWSLCNLGDYLYANPLGGTIYQWTTNLSQRARVLANAPAVVDFLVATPQRTLMALGCTDTDGVYKPTTYRWCDTEDPAWWTPNVNLDGTGGAPNLGRFSQAGAAHLGTGSFLVCGASVAGGILAWTDTDLYQLKGSVDASAQTLTYLPGNPIGNNCGPVGPLAVAAVEAAAYWLSSNGGFYIWASGTPSQLSCPVKKWVLSAIDPAQAWKVTCRIDSFYNAVEWRYPRLGNEVSDQVRIDLNEVGAGVANGWTVGATQHSIVLDQGLFPTPLGVSMGGLVSALETGLSANGAAYERWLEWAPQELPTQDGDGERRLECNKIVFDAVLNPGGAVQISFPRQDDPSAAPTVYGPVTLPANKGSKSVRFQTRLMGLKIHTNGTDDLVRVGQVKLDLTPVGRR